MQFITAGGMHFRMATAAMAESRWLLKDCVKAQKWVCAVLCFCCRWPCEFLVGQALKTHIHKIEFRDAGVTLTFGENWSWTGVAGVMFNFACKWTCKKQNPWCALDSKSDVKENERAHISAILDLAYQSGTRIVKYQDFQAILVLLIGTLHVLHPTWGPLYFEMGLPTLLSIVEFIDLHVPRSAETRYLRWTFRESNRLFPINLSHLGSRRQARISWTMLYEARKLHHSSVCTTHKRLRRQR